MCLVMTKLYYLVVLEDYLTYDQTDIKIRLPYCLNIDLMKLLLFQFLKIYTLKQSREF